MIDQSKILALVSTFEGLPTVFLEAMALGVIPVGYDTFPSIYDLIDDGESGYIVPFENKEEYAKVLLKIAKNDKLRQKMAENAKKKSKKFSINEIGRIWIDIFNSMKRYESL
ncbi:glycosyltransferase [Parabacteroides sp.]